MKLLKGIQVFLLSVVSLFVSGQYIWANADEEMHEASHKHKHCKSHKAKKMLKSASIALNEFTCKKVCKVNNSSEKSMGHHYENQHRYENEHRYENGNHHDNSENENRYENEHRYENKHANKDVSDTSNNCDVSNKDVKSYSESDNDGIKTDRSWDGEYNHNYDVSDVSDNSEHAVNKVLICRDVNMNENFNFSDIKDIVVIKGNLGGGNNFHLKDGDDIIAISGNVNGNVSIDGGNGVDVLMLVKGLDSYTFSNFTNNNGIISSQIIDKDTGKTITINNMEGLRFGNVNLVPTSDPQSAISQGSSVLKLDLNGAGLTDILSNIQVLKQNGEVLFKYNDNIYDTVVINTDSNNALVLLGERSLGLLWKEN
ncbi:MAG: hypothetical protein DSY47_05230 [Hydrogenothermus sp.]|nr:MAG: hypothetical protein DSY47_05230 [Hydrogenothermus sp.]